MSIKRYHNKPESEALTESERPTVAAGRDALRSLSKTFDLWVVVGRGIKVLRVKAKAIGGKKTFQRLLAQNKYNSIDTSVITKLLKILDRLPEVEAWRAKLTEKQQREWSAPTTVFKHCQVFGGKPPAKRAQPSVTKDLGWFEREVKRLEDLVAELEAEADDPSGSYEMYLKTEPVEMRVVGILELLDEIDLPLEALIKRAKDDGYEKLLRGLPDVKKRKPAPERVEERNREGL